MNKRGFWIQRWATDPTAKIITPSLQISCWSVHLHPQTLQSTNCILDHNLQLMILPHFIHGIDFIYEMNSFIHPQDNSTHTQHDFHGQGLHTSSSRSGWGVLVSRQAEWPREKEKHAANPFMWRLHLKIPTELSVLLRAWRLETHLDWCRLRAEVLVLSKQWSVLNRNCSFSTSVREKGMEEHQFRVRLVLLNAFKFQD